MTFPNYSSLRAQPFWEREGSGRSVILNVPATFPARAMNGVMISGFVALDLERATYPSSLVQWLKDADYRVDVDSQAAHKSVDLFLRDLDRTLRARMRAYRYLWDTEDWDVFMLVFTGTDRLAHFLWDAYEDDKHPYHPAFLDHLRQVDDAIADVSRRITDDDALIVLSDHGFERLACDVYINFFLRQEGFLKLDGDTARRPQDIGDGTHAFALDPGRVYVHLESKYPRGTVQRKDREATIDDLTCAFKALEVDGRRVVRRVCRKKEIYEGPMLSQAPDLVLLANKGFNLRGSINARQLSKKGVFMGKHSQANAFLITWGRQAQEATPLHPCVSDVAGIVYRLQMREGR